MEPRLVLRQQLRLRRQLLQVQAAVGVGSPFPPHKLYLSSRWRMWATPDELWAFCTTKDLLCCAQRKICCFVRKTIHNENSAKFTFERMNNAPSLVRFRPVSWLFARMGSVWQVMNVCTMSSLHLHDSAHGVTRFTECGDWTSLCTNLASRGPGRSSWLVQYASSDSVYKAPKRNIHGVAG